MYLFIYTYIHTYVHTYIYNTIRNLPTSPASAESHLRAQDLPGTGRCQHKPSSFSRELPA